MRVIPKVNYEALMLFPQSANVDLKGTVEHVKEILTKYKAEIVALKKWGDRQLAFPIKKQKRGVYVLCYFNAPTSSLQEIERAFNLSEQILRTMIIRVDHMTTDEMKAADAQIDLMIEANLRAPVESVATPVPQVPAEI